MAGMRRKSAVYDHGVKAIFRGFTKIRAEKGERTFRLTIRSV